MICEPVSGPATKWEVTPRTLHISKAMKARILQRQHGRCSTCRERFKPRDKIQFDHGHDLQFGGPDIEANLFAKHVDCHMMKTKANATQAARIRKIAGITKKQARSRKIESRGFDKSRTRGFDGNTRPRAPGGR